MHQVETVTADTKSNSRVWNKTFTSIFLTNIAMYLGQWIVNTLVSKYADYMGASAAVVGIVSSLFALTALVLKIISGPAIDTFNRKYLLMGALAILGISFAGMGLSTSVSGLMLFRLIQGCGQAFTATCCLALAADALPREKFGSGIGIFTLAQAACQAIGPTVGLTLAEKLGYRLTFLIAASIEILAIILALFISIKHTKTKKFSISWNSIFAVEALQPAIIIFLLGMTFSVITSFLVIYAGKENVENIGYFFTIYAGMLLITRPLIGKLSDKFGFVKVILPAMAAFALSFIVISFSRNIWTFLLAAFVSAFGFGAWAFS